MPGFCARTRLKDHVTLYPRRNKEYFARAAFCLFNRCRNKAGFLRQGRLADRGLISGRHDGVPFPSSVGALDPWTITTHRENGRPLSFDARRGPAGGGRQPAHAGHVRGDRAGEIYRGESEMCKGDLPVSFVVFFPLPFLTAVGIISS